jgi:hypothetical protein
VHLRVEHGAPKAALARMLIRASVSIPPLSYSSRMAIHPPPLPLQPLSLKGHIMPRDPG